jgi:hypothetical protein
MNEIIFPILPPGNAVSRRDVCGETFPILPPGNAVSRRDVCGDVAWKSIIPGEAWKDLFLGERTESVERDININCSTACSILKKSLN